MAIKIGRNKDPNEILTVKEVAFILKVHQNTIRDLLANDVLEGFRLGKRGRWRISRASLDKFTQSKGVQK